MRRAKNKRRKSGLATRSHLLMRVTLQLIHCLIPLRAYRRMIAVTPRCNDATVTPGVKLTFLLNMCLIIIISCFFQLPLLMQIQMLNEIQNFSNMKKNVHHVPNIQQLILVVNQHFCKGFKWPKLLKTVT